MAFSSKSQEIKCGHYPCSCCKDREDKSTLPAINDPNKMKNTLHILEHRFCSLTERRQYLIEKICNMEKTMPLLMASALSSSPNEANSYINALLSSNCDDKKKEDNGTNEDNAEDTIDNLNEQVDKLYDEIIKTEMEFEEAMTSFASLEAINLELETKLSSMRGGNKTHPEIENLNDLYKIISQDNDEDDDNILNCLKKLKVFVQQEINLKKCINVLEKREKCLNSQFDKLLSDKGEINVIPAKGFAQCAGKNCHRRKEDESKIDEDDDGDDDDDEGISKYCDCCPLSKNG